MLEMINVKCCIALRRIKRPFRASFSSVSALEGRNMSAMGIAHRKMRFSAQTKLSISIFFCSSSMAPINDSGRGGQPCT